MATISPFKVFLEIEKPQEFLRLLYILGSFTDGQIGQALTIALNKVPNPVRIGFGIIPQTPAHGLIDEKFRLVEVVEQDFFQQIRLGLVLTKELVVNGHAAEPKIVICGPV